jgi:hypothetical protein
MLKNVSRRINDRIAREDSLNDFKNIFNESYEDKNIDNFLDKLNEGNDIKMYNEFDYLFENTTSDAELNTFLQDETFAKDNGVFNPTSDFTDDDLTSLQEPKDYSDNFSAHPDTDLNPRNSLTNEVMYSDTQKTPVNIDEFSNEAADIFMEMGDIDTALDEEEASDADTDAGTLDEEEDESDLDEDFSSFFEDEDTSAELDECGDSDTSLDEDLASLFEEDESDLDEDFSSFFEDEDVSDLDEEGDVNDLEECGSSDSDLDEELNSLFEAAEKDYEDEDDDKKKDNEDESLEEAFFGFDF